MRTRIIFYLRCAAYLRLLPRTRPQPNTAVDSNTLTEAGYARSDYENNPTVLHPVISLQFQFTLQKTQHISQLLQIFVSDIYPYKKLYSPLTQYLLYPHGKSTIV